jgi:hypothetical protein
MEKPGYKAEGEDRIRIGMALTSPKDVYDPLDPSESSHRQLDQRVAEYILRAAENAPIKAEFHLAVHLQTDPDDASQHLPQAIAAYFAHRADIEEMNVRQIRTDGRWAMLRSLLIILAALGINQFIVNHFEGTFAEGLAESFLILGWVAVWRPAEMLLFDRGPVQRRKRLMQRLARMKVDAVRVGGR